MPRHEIARLSDDATIWVFGIEPALDGPKSAALLQHVDGFLDGWAAHGVPVESAREIVEGRLLVIAAEKTAETSGCSIDKLFGVVRQLESGLEASMLDANRVFYRDAAGAIASATRSEFREKATPGTIVIDTTVARLGDVRSGAWEKPAGESWHRALVKVSA